MQARRRQQVTQAGDGALDERLALAEQSLAYAQRTRSLVETQYRAGGVSGLERREVEQVVAAQEAAITQLRQTRTEAREALRRFPEAQVQWIPRHRNGAADTLARAALGLAPKAATPQSQTIKKRRRR